MRILVIPDAHLPYVNMELLKEIYQFSKKYSPHEIISIGDFFDNYSLTSFIKDCNAESSSEELEKTYDQIQKIKEWFPKITFIKGNHEKRLDKRAKDVGINNRFIKSIFEVMKAPAGWHPEQDDVIERDGILYTHGFHCNFRKHLYDFNQSIVFGHIHKSFGIDYMSRNGRMIYAMCVGTVIDDQAIAFQYGPIKYRTACLGFGSVTDGIPQIFPLLDVRGR